MRLTQLLMVWPKKRPNGNIWIGKNRMVQKVQPWHMSNMEKDIERWFYYSVDNYALPVSYPIWPEEYKN